MRFITLIYNVLSFLPFAIKLIALFRSFVSRLYRVEWINQGEKRNSYIPARPDEYYGRLGQWISWDHFLSNTVEDEDRNGTAEEGAFG